jgi:Zn-dependent metalloprotease
MVKELNDVLTQMFAHEHAVCENSKLSVPKESGAMNEAFSDIWGACIEYTQHLELGGEDIKKSPSLRSMSDPKSEGQPDTYGGTN